MKPKKTKVIGRHLTRPGRPRKGRVSLVASVLAQLADQPVTRWRLATILAAKIGASRKTGYRLIAAAGRSGIPVPESNSIHRFLSRCQEEKRSEEAARWKSSVWARLSQEIPWDGELRAKRERWAAMKRRARSYAVRTHA